jgi:hypothetical protein
MAVPQQTEDAGLPDKNRRDPHKQGESPALQSPEDVEVFFDGGEGKDTGLPDKSRRDPHKPGESPALQVQQV